jgi:hypothetical protein
MSDEKYFLLATQEFDSNNTDQAIWAKAMALSEGDNAKAKWKYISLRAASLAEMKESSVVDKFSGSQLNRGGSLLGSDKTQPEGELPPKTDALYAAYNSSDDPSLLELQEFSDLSGWNQSKLIELIRDGTITGRKSGNKWFVGRDSIAVLFDIGSASDSVSEKPSIWKYLGAWILWSVLSRILGLVIGLVGGALFGRHAGDVIATVTLVTIASVVTVFCFWLIYEKLFTSLSLSRVMPWVYVTSGIGLVLELLKAEAQPWNYGDGFHATMLIATPITAYLCYWVARSAPNYR